MLKLTYCWCQCFGLHEFSVETGPGVFNFGDRTRTGPYQENLAPEPDQSPSWCSCKCWNWYELYPVTQHLKRHCISENFLWQIAEAQWKKNCIFKTRKNLWLEKFWAFRQTLVAHALILLYSVRWTHCRILKQFGKVFGVKIPRFFWKNTKVLLSGIGTRFWESLTVYLRDYHKKAQKRNSQEQRNFVKFPEISRKNC